MKREAKILLGKSIDSLVLSVEHFNRPWDRGRPEAVLILLDRAFELLLKAAILHKGGKLREKPNARETFGFGKCLQKTISEQRVKCVTDEQAITAQLINSLRDAAQHHFLEISEHQLYIGVRAGVTVYGDLLNSIFGQRLFDHLPERIIPISTRTPTSLEVLMDVEFQEIKKLVAARSRSLLRAKGKMRTLATLEASLRGERQQPSDAELARMLDGVRQSDDWRSVFPGISTLNLETSEGGLSVHLRITKKDGQAVHIVPEGTPGSTPIAIRRVDELGFYSLGLRALAGHFAPGLSESKLLALIQHLKLQDSDEYFKELVIGKSRFKRYSRKALETLKEQLPKLDVEAIWARQKETQRNLKKKR